ncbi:MAG: hypothetical protein JWQ63_1854 [Mucilaginibacter sp.]|nr:hypothetical protein [Mucilaginibacter sp.]
MDRCRGNVRNFIPIVINYKATEDIKIIKEDAVKARTDSENALSEISLVKKESELASQQVEFAVSNSEKANLGAQTAIFNSANAVTKATEASVISKNALVESGIAKGNSTTAINEAKEASKRALHVEQLLTSLNDISKIKDIDGSFLLYNDNPFETLKSYLKDIYSSLNNSSDIFDKPIIKDIFRQLSLRLHLIAPYDFIEPQNFDLLNTFSLDLSNLINVPLTEDSFMMALSFLHTLNTNLAINHNASL